MTKEMILDLISELSKSQGFYGRLLENIKEDPTILDYWENLNFKSNIDFIMYLES